MMHVRCMMKTRGQTNGKKVVNNKVARGGFPFWQLCRGENSNAGTQVMYVWLVVIWRFRRSRLSLRTSAAYKSIGIHIGIALS